MRKMIAALLLFVILLPSAHAEKTDFGGFSTSSMIMESTGKPGETINSSFTIFNDSELDVIAELQMKDFQKEAGQIRFLDNLEPQLSVRSWTTFKANSLPLQSGQSATVDFSISVPKDAEQGEHAALVSVRFVPVGQDGNVKLTTELLPVYYVTVTDENGNLNLHKDWTLLKINTDRINGNHMSFEVKNLGNVHLKSSGKVKLTNRFNGTATEVPIPEVNLLRNDTKTIVVELPIEDKFAWYQADVEFSMDGARFEKSSLSLFYINWLITALVVLGIVLLLTAFQLYARSYRKKLEQQFQFNRVSNPVSIPSNPQTDYRTDTGPAGEAVLDPLNISSTLSRSRKRK